jgi:hypothetical protein
MLFARHPDAFAGELNVQNMMFTLRGRFRKLF